MAKILYVFSGVAFGSLGSDSFSNAYFIINVLTDTSRITTSPPTYPAGTPQVTSTTGTDTITLFNPSPEWTRSAVFNFSLAVTVLPFEAPENAGVVVGLDPDQLLAVKNSALVGYGLDGAIGPVTGAQPIMPTGRNYPTSAGDLVFTSISQAAFQAVPLGDFGPAAPQNLRLGAAENPS